MEVTKFLLAKGADIHNRDADGDTPLFQAAMGGNAEALQLLINAGGKVVDRNNTQRTPLHYAAQRGQVEAAKLLVANGADVHAKADVVYVG